MKRMAVALAACLLVECGIAAGAEPAALITLDIRSQPMGDALNEFARQSGLQIVVEPRAAAGITAPPLSGSFTAGQALERLLAHSGLRYEYLNERTIAVWPHRAINTSDAPSQAQGDLRLARAPAAADAPEDAQADDAESREAPADSVITVTATRPSLYVSRVVTSGVLGDKDPLDIPFSISSFTSELAKLQGAYTPAEILKNDPAVQNPGFDIYQNWMVIRGFRAQNGSVRRDGLYANGDGDFPIEAFERVEVVKGVAGFLYGFAEPGGIQNYVTKRPTRDAFGTLDVQLRSGSGRYAHLDAGGPVRDGRFGWRANTAYEDQGDFTHRGDIHRTMGSFSFDARASDALLLRLDASHQVRELAGQFGLPLTSQGREPPEYDPTVSVVPSWTRSKFTSSSVTLRAEYRLSGDWQILAQGGRDWSNADTGFGIVTSIEPNGDFTEDLYSDPRDDNRNRWNSGQLMALGELRTGPIRHELAFGVFRRQGKFRLFSSTNWGPIPVSGNLFDLAFPERPAFDPGSYYLYLSDTVSETHFFAGDTLRIGERWQMMLGGRHVDVKFNDDRAKELSPSAALVFKPRQSATLYASYARSLQEGYRCPCEITDATNARDLQPPIQARQIEIGMKARVRGTLDLGLAAYRIELPSDYVNEELRLYGRYGEQVNRGLELTAAGNVLPNLAVIAGIGYLDAKRTRNQDPTLDGNRVEGLSDWTANLFANYGVSRIPGLAFTAGLYWAGSRVLDLQNAIPVDGYTRLDIGARYRLQGVRMPVTLRFNASNLLDEFYWEGLGYGTYAAGPGRTYSIAAEMQFY